MRNKNEYSTRDLHNNFEKAITKLYEDFPEYTKYVIPRLIAILQKNFLSFEFIYKNMFPELEGYKIESPDENIKKEVTENTTIMDLEKSYEYYLMDNEKNKVSEFFSNKELILEYNKHIDVYMERILFDHDTVAIMRLRNVLTVYRKELHKKVPQTLIIHLLKLLYKFFVVDVPKANNRHETSYFIIKNGIYQEINRGWLMNILNREAAANDVEIFLTLDDCSKILSYIGDVKEFNPNYVELENVYIKKSNMEIIPKSDKYILTDDRLGLQDSGAIKLFSYDPDMTLDSINDNNITETFKILKEILIPKQSPTNIKYLQFYLQVIGLMVHGKNDIKILPLFYREGNNGKTILKDIAEMLFKEGSISIAGNEFKDKFINESINHASHCILNDELDIDDIKKYQSSYKNISGGSSIGGRAMYSTEQRRVEEIAPALLCSNYIPNIPIDKENEAIIKRLIIIAMPNKFVENYEYNPNKNHYRLRSNIKQIIKNDFEGLNQVLNVAINEYKKLDYNKNVKEQLAVSPTIQDTLFLLTKENPLFSYMMLNLEETAENTPMHQRITINDIVMNFTEWYKPQNNGLEPPEAIVKPVAIGKAIKNVFPEIDPKTDGNKYHYNLKFKSNKELKTKDYELIIAHPRNIENKSHIINGLEERIHDFIMANPNGNCEHDIIEEFEPTGYDLEDIMSSIQHLNEIGLIEYEHQTTL